MKTFIKISVVLFIVVILSGCNSQTEVMETEDQRLEQITGFYILQVTRIAEHPAVEFPGDTLSEDQYSIDSRGKEYEILFSSDGNQISIQRDSIIGYRSFQSNHLTRYDLLQGLSAGGRFIVWLNENSLEAELSIYGSGVPIIMSEKGKLIKKSR